VEEDHREDIRGKVGDKLVHRKEEGKVGDKLVHRREEGKVEVGVVEHRPARISSCYHQLTRSLFLILSLMLA